MGFYEDMEKSLLEAISMEKGEIPIVQKEDMPAPTYAALEKEKKLIDEFTVLRKTLNISQKELAERTGNRQQAISRLEKKENSPSLKFFLNLLNALGYDLKIEKC